MSVNDFIQSKTLFIFLSFLMVVLFTTFSIQKQIVGIVLWMLGFILIYDKPYHNVFLVILLAIGTMIVETRKIEGFKRGRGWQRWVKSPLKSLQDTINKAILPTIIAQATSVIPTPEPTCPPYPTLTIDMVKNKMPTLTPVPQPPDLTMFDATTNQQNMIKYNVYTDLKQKVDNAAQTIVKNATSYQGTCGKYTQCDSIPCYQRDYKYALDALGIS